MKIFIGSDHRGFTLKQQLIQSLTAAGHSMTDCGDQAPNPDDDYTDFAFAVAGQVLKNPGSRGILICGSGIGVSIAANRVRGVRAALGLSPAQISAARQEDDVTILCLASDFTAEPAASEMIRSFLETEFLLEERYTKRLMKLDDTV